MGKQNKSLLIKIQKNICLGFVSVSIVFISFVHVLSYIGIGTTISSAVLSAIFLGLIIGFSLVHFKPILLKKRIKCLYFLSALIIAFFLSNLFMTFLWSHFRTDWAFVFFLFFANFIPFLLLGCLIGVELSNSIGLSAFGLMTFGFGILLGTIITEWILLNIFGIAWSIVLNVCLLLCCIIFEMKNFNEELIGLSATIGIIVVALGLNVQLNNNDVFYKNFRAINHENYKPVAPYESLAASFLPSSPKPSNDEYPYLPLIAKILYQNLNLKDQNVLVLGIGGYQLAKNNTHNIHFTFYNFLTNQLPSACDFLDVLTGGNNILSAAEKIIWKPQKSYAVIISNIFPRNIPIPPVLLSYQQILKVREALPENGVAIFNVVARPTLTDLYSKRVDNTIHAVFPSCMDMPLVYSESPTNIIYICRKSAEENDNTIYTNNFDAAKLDAFNQFLERESHGRI